MLMLLRQFVLTVPSRTDLSDPLTRKRRSEGKCHDGALAEQDAACGHVVRLDPGIPSRQLRRLAALRRRVPAPTVQWFLCTA
jgi:hypothetical protein